MSISSKQINPSNSAASSRNSGWLRILASLFLLTVVACNAGGESTSPKKVNCEQECPCDCDCPEAAADGDSKENAPYPWVLIGTVKVTEGALSQDIAKRKVTGQRYALRECYTPALKKDPNLAGEMDVQFTVSGGTGKIIASIVRDSTIEDKKVQKCMTKKIKEWTFPKSESKDSVVKFTIGIVPISL